MSGNANIGGCEEYSLLGAFPVINISLLAHAVTEGKNGQQ